MISKQDIVNITGTYSLTMPDARHEAWVDQAIDLELVPLAGDEFVAAYRAYNPNDTTKPEFNQAYLLANKVLAYQVMTYVNAEWGINISQSGVTVPNDPSGTFTAANAQQRSNLVSKYNQLSNSAASKLSKYLHEKNWTLDNVVYEKVEKTNNINQIITSPIAHVRGKQFKTRRYE